MTRGMVALVFLTFLSGRAWCEGPEASPPTVPQATVQQLSAAAPVQAERRFFPQNFVRGYIDFEIAPPHNEIDTGLCALATNNTDFEHHPTCTAYARYVWSSYLELQPFGRGQWQRLFFFVEPKLYGGENLPQHSYTASASLILWERTLGVGVELPQGFELRVKNHHVNLLGRYTETGGTATLRTDGPYGQYTTVGVRWNFGGYGRSRGDQ
jgi:hypothetical protein